MIYVGFRKVSAVMAVIEGLISKFSVAPYAVKLNAPVRAKIQKFRLRHTCLRLLCTCQKAFVQKWCVFGKSEPILSPVKYHSTLNSAKLLTKTVTPNSAKYRTSSKNTPKNKRNPSKNIQFTRRDPRVVKVTRDYPKSYEK